MSYSVLKSKPFLFTFLWSLCLFSVNAAAEDFLSLISDAQDDNIASAQHALGMMYLQGNDVVADPKKAFEWFEKAVAQDYLPSVYEMAVMYRDGIGRAADKKKAFELFRKAAQQGYPEAKEAYTHMLVIDEFYKQDPAAAEWVLAAAQAGDADAQFVMGDMYQNGLGVGKSIGDARDWYRKAASNGHQRAQLRLDGCKNC